MIVQDFVSENKYSIKCPYAMIPEFIVIHNTANDGSAKNEIAYMQKNLYATSFHFAVDDAEVRQALPLDRNAWHAGDGENGKGNRKGIAIEICYSKSGGEKFLKAEENSAKLTAQILMERGWGIDRVKKHQDFSGKYCPHRTLDLGWDRFIEKVKKYMIEDITTVEGVVQELADREILTAKDYWLNKLKEDNNAFCLARNCINYIRRAEK